MNEYQGHWISTFLGKRFHYLEPKEEEINILDIAHALSLTCRFGGHCKTFYSVAEHSIRVALLVDKNPLAALLHDAHEAYLHDVPRPIKQDMPIYSKITDKIQEVINKKYSIDSTDTSEIKKADDILLSTEARDLLNNTQGWEKLPASLESTIFPFDSVKAEKTFLFAFYRYLENRYDEKVQRRKL